MRACIQRVQRARVTVGGVPIGSVEKGLVVLLGVAHDDTETDVHYLAEKTAGLRIFDDPAGKMNLAVGEVGGGILVVSQFTLLADCRQGRRPSFVGAAPPALAEQLYESFVRNLTQRNLPTACGQFRASMQVELVNDGPVTIILDSRDKQPSRVSELPATD